MALEARGRWAHFSYFTDSNPTRLIVISITWKWSRVLSQCLRLHPESLKVSIFWPSTFFVNSNFLLYADDIKVFLLLWNHIQPKLQEFSIMMALRTETIKPLEQFYPGHQTWKISTFFFDNFSNFSHLTNSVQNPTLWLAIGYASSCIVFQIRHRCIALYYYYLIIQ